MGSALRLLRQLTLKRHDEAPQKGMMKPRHAAALSLGLFGCGRGLFAGLSLSDWFGLVLGVFIAVRVGISAQTKEFPKPPLAARLIAALSIAGLFVFAIFLGRRFTHWQRILVAYAILSPAVISVIIVEWRRRRKPQRPNGNSKAISSN